MLLFRSNLFIILAFAATGNSIPLQLSSFDFLIKSFVILSGLLFDGFNALVIHHLKHSQSSFFRLIIAFLLASFSGNGMYELPFKGLYTILCISNLTTAVNLQLLPCI